MADYIKSLDMIVLPEREAADRFLIIELDKAYSAAWSGDSLGREIFESAARKAIDLGPQISRWDTTRVGKLRGTGLITHKPWVYWRSHYDNRRILYQENSDQALIELSVNDRFDQWTESYAIGTLLRLKPADTLGFILIYGNTKHTVDELALKLELPDEYRE
jgi:hypothetical protein